MQHGTPRCAVVSMPEVLVNVAKLVCDHVGPGLAESQTKDNGTEQTPDGDWRDRTNKGPRIFFILEQDNTYDEGGVDWRDVEGCSGEWRDVVGCNVTGPNDRRFSCLCAIAEKDEKEDLWWYEPADKQ